MANRLPSADTGAVTLMATASIARASNNGLDTKPDAPQAVIPNRDGRVVVAMDYFEAVAGGLVNAWNEAGGSIPSMIPALDQLAAMKAETGSDYVGELTKALEGPYQKTFEAYLLKAVAKDNALRFYESGSDATTLPLDDPDQVIQRARDILLSLGCTQVDIGKPFDNSRERNRQLVLDAQREVADEIILPTEIPSSPGPLFEL